MTKNYRIVLFSNNKSATNEVSFSYFHLIFFSLIVVLIFASITVFSVVVVSRYLYSYRLDLLHQEKTLIQNELVNINAAFSDLQERLNTLYVKDDELRTEIKLEPFDPSLREIGIGGGEEIASNQSEFFFAEQELLAEITPRLEELKHQVIAEEESYTAMREGLLEHKEWLRYYPGAAPVEGGIIKSPFGWRPDPLDGNKMRRHDGLDIGGLPIGTPVYATADGVVSVVQHNADANALGKYIKIEHNAQKYGWITMYGHLSKIEPHIRKGTIVKRGERIGELGDTGRNTGPHLHYEIQYRDPKSKRLSPIDPQLAHLNPNAYKRKY